MQDRSHARSTPQPVSRRRFLQLSLLGAGAAGLALAAGRAAAAPAPRPARRAPAQLTVSGPFNVLYMSSGTYDTAARDMAPEFKEKFGVEVTVVDFPYLTLHEKELTDLVSGSGAYDVIAVAAQWDGEFAPYLTPLDDLIARDNIDMDRFIPNIRRLSGYWDGVQYGIPNANDAMGIIYRTDLYEAAGLKPPTSWEEYTTVHCPKLHAIGIANGIYGTSFVGGEGGAQLQGYWITRYWEQGDPLCDENWRPIFNNEKGVRAIELLRAILPYSPPGTAGMAFPDHVQFVLSGQAAQGELWPSFVRADARNPEKSKIVGKWAITPFPGPSELSMWNLAIPKGAKNKEAAWEWIKLYTSPEKSREFAVKYGIGSPQKAIWEDPELIAQYPEYPAIYRAIANGKPIWRIAQFAEAWDVLQAELVKAVFEKADAKETLDKIARRWNELLDQNPPTVKYTEG